MNPRPDHQRVRELFEAACDRPPERRAEYLDAAAAGDPELRAEVESLLRFDAASGDLLSEGRFGRELLGDDSAPEEDQESVPERIGTYRIIRRIGSGGMGSVYEAEQAAPHRRVALKVMRRGPGSRRLARRFEREGRIQAALTHPFVAAVYETGVDTSLGGPTPYFAMELVEGRSIVDFARRKTLNLRERLGVMAEVCDAVSYAHQRGVIHRDLKPDNIMVVETERGPVPKVLDFGVATFTDHDLRAATMQTEAGQIIGTLTYMSPEQVSGKLDEVDTRTDIYALGVVLFELLSGRPCHDTRDLPLAEAARRITFDEPERLGDLQPSLRGDVETVVHKALSRDKLLRYASASELAADIRRYLTNEPITARPATVMYQLSKFAARHRSLVAAIVICVVTLIGAVIAMSMMTVAARRSRDIAEAKTIVAEGVSQTLLSAFNTATPKGSRGKEPYLIDAINRIESQAQSVSSRTSPEVKAVVLNICGIIHRERGDYARAEEVFLKALAIRREILEPTDPNLADSLNNMGLLRKRQERYAEAADYYQQAVDLQRLSSFPDPARLARNIYNLASVYISAGEFEKAKPLLEESMTLHLKLPHHEELLGYHVSARARIAKGEGRLHDALALAEQALAMQREALDSPHPTIANALSELGDLVALNGDAPRGLELLREADAMATEVFPGRPMHPIAKTIRAALVQALRNAQRPDEADTLEQDAN